MRATSMRRLIGGAAALMLIGTMLLSTTGSVLASPPKWVMPVVTLPSAVSPGAAAGYRVTITNNGPSNISSLYLVDDQAAIPTYLVTSRAGTCGATNPATDRLYCAFGALNALDSVTITVAYTTPASGATSYAIQFQANTTGVTFSDVKNRSHGDQLTTSASTALNANKNFAGAFSIDTDTVIGDSDQLTGNNKQATALSGLPAGIDATVEDGTGTGGSCTSSSTLNCAGLFGEWSVTNVGEGRVFPDGFIVAITYKTGTPNFFVHSYIDFSVDPKGILRQEVVGTCAATPVAPCFTWAGNTATIITTHNGSWKAG